MLKKRIALSLALLAFFAGGAAAQTNDSLTFVKAKWNKEKVAKGIEWRQYHFTGEEKIFDAEEFVNVVVVDQKKAKRRFVLVALDGKLRRTSQAALDSAAIVAINGSFYNTRRTIQCATSRSTGKSSSSVRARWATATAERS